MGKRYFNIKEGDPKVNGGVIEVDISQSLENRLKDFINNAEAKQWNFKLVKEVKNGAFYKLVISKQKFMAEAHILVLSVNNVSAGYVETGEVKANVFLTNEGGLRIRRTKEGKEVYVNEINKNIAENMREDAYNWFLQQLWVVD